MNNPGDSVSSWYALVQTQTCGTYTHTHTRCMRQQHNPIIILLCRRTPVQFNFITLPCSILISNYVFAHWIFLVMRNLRHRRNWIFKSHSENPWVNKFCFDLGRKEYCFFYFFYLKSISSIPIVKLQIFNELYLFTVCWWWKN